MQQEQIGWSDGNVINNSTYPQCEPLCEMNKDCKGIRWIVGASDSQSSLINQCQLLSTLGDTNTDIRWRHAIKDSGTQQDSDLLDILTQEAEMKNAINSYEQIMADKPSVSCTPMPPLGGLTSSTWIETIRNNMQKNIPWYIGLPESWWYGKTGEDAINIIETSCGGSKSLSTLSNWTSKGIIASQNLETKAKSLESTILKNLTKSDRDKDIANMNISGLDKMITNLNKQRDDIIKNVDELKTLNAVDTNLKMEYKSEYIQYTAFFTMMIIVTGLLIRIQRSEISGSAELVVLVLAILYLIYHVSSYLTSPVTSLFKWLFKSLNQFIGFNY